MKPAHRCNRFAILVWIISCIALGFPRANAISTAPSKPGTSLEATLNQFGIIRGPADKEKGVQEFRLKSNGLTILLAERRAAPVVTLMMLFQVGSRNEAVGYTGATHFLEHMMFKGSKHFDPLRRTGIDDVLKPVGGINNATTWFDRTSYYEVLPAQNLDIAIRLEADRIRGLLLRESDRRSEMTVVRNELERAENEPRSILDTQLFATAYREHPYHHPTIGWRSDVEGVPTARLRQFYQDFYWPSNATMLIIGDFEPANALASVARYFNPIPRSPNPIPKVYTTEPLQEGERRFTVQRGEDLPRVSIAYHIPKAAHKDIYPLAVIQSVLGDHSRLSTRLYKRLIDSSLASEVDCYSYELRDPGLFTLSATANATSKPEDMEKALLAEVQRLKTEPVDPAELTKAKTAIIKRLKLSTVDPLSLASQIGEGIASVDWKWWASYEKNIEAVTADDIMRVAKKYFYTNNQTVGFYLPRTPPAKPAIPEPPVKGPEKAPGYRRQEHVSPLARTADSRVGPVAGTASFASRVQRKVLPNGLTILVMPISGSGTISMSGKIRAGKYFTDSGKTLIPEILADMLPKGSANYSKDKLAQELELMGTSLDFDPGNFFMSFDTNLVSSDLGRMAPILADVLQRPLFPSDELEKSRKVYEAQIKQDMVDTREVARNTLDNKLYEPESVYYEPSFQDKLKQVASVSTDDLKSFHQRCFSPANTVIAVVGDVQPAVVYDALQKHLGNWTGPAQSKFTKPKVKLPAGSNQIKIPLEDKQNVDISIGAPSELNIKSSDFHAALIGNAALGHGPFSTRLSPVREKYGLSYDIYSTFSDTTFGGAPWIVELSVNPENTTKALEIVDGIVKGYLKNGITSEELNTEAKHLAGEFVVGLRTPSEIASHLARYEMVGLGPRFIDEFAGKLRSVRKSDVDAAIRKYFHLEKALTTMAGTFSKPKD